MRDIRHFMPRLRSRALTPWRFLSRKRRASCCQKRPLPESHSLLLRCFGNNGKKKKHATVENAKVLESEGKEERHTPSTDETERQRRRYLVSMDTYVLTRLRDSNYIARQGGLVAIRASLDSAL